jgi:hypothetical protein
MAGGAAAARHQDCGPEDADEGRTGDGRPRIRVVHHHPDPARRSGAGRWVMRPQCPSILCALAVSALSYFRIYVVVIDTEYVPLNDVTFTPA